MSCFALSVREVTRDRRARVHGSILPSEKVLLFGEFIKEPVAYRLPTSSFSSRSRALSRYADSGDLECGGLTPLSCDPA